MTSLGNPLTGLFAFLNGAGSGTGNGFGISVGSLLASEKGEGTPSPFSQLIARDGLLLSSLPSLVSEPKIAKDPIVEEDVQDLSSPDLLLSDLLALNFNNIHPGDVVQLPNGYTITASSNGTFTLENEALGIEIDPFSIIEIQTLLQPFVANIPSDSGSLNLDGKPNIVEDKISPDRLGLRTDAIDQDGVAQPKIDPAINVVDDSTQEINAKFGKTTIADVVQSLQKQSDSLTSNPATLTAAAAQNITSVPNKSIIQRSNDPLKLVSENPSPIPSSSGFIVQNFDDFFVPSASDISIANNSFYHQFGLKESGAGALTGSTPLTPQQLQIVIQRLVKNGETKSLSVRLDPAELGRVQVDLSTAQNKGLRVHVLVEKAETLHLLKYDLSSLEKALNNVGVSIEDGSVTFNLADDGGQSGSFAQQAFEESWKEKNAHALAAQNRDFDETGTIDAIDIINQTYVADGRVNIKV